METAIKQKPELAAYRELTDFLNHLNKTNPGHPGKFGNLQAILSIAHDIARYDKSEQLEALANELFEYLAYA